MIIIALGSNLSHEVFGAPPQVIGAALSALEVLGVQVAASSRLYDSVPVPASDQPNFVNAAATVETEHQTREGRCTAIVVGVDAEAPMIAVHHRRMRFRMMEAGIPHERAIPEYPEITTLGERRGYLRVIARRPGPLRTHACFASMLERRIARVRVKRSSSF